MNLVALSSGVGSDETASGGSLDVAGYPKMGYVAAAKRKNEENQGFLMWTTGIVAQQWMA